MCRGYVNSDPPIGEMELADFPCLGGLYMTLSEHLGMSIPK